MSSSHQRTYSLLCLVFFFFLFFLGVFLSFEIGFCYEAQAGSEFTILLSSTSLVLELNSEVTGLKLKFIFVCLFVFFLSKTESHVTEDDFDLISSCLNLPKARIMGVCPYSGFI